MVSLLLTVYGKYNVPLLAIWKARLTGCKHICKPLERDAYVFIFLRQLKQYFWGDQYMIKIYFNGNVTKI